MNKSFIITVDTEGDNLWEWKDGQLITTENSRFISCFQELCEEFGFIPTYLTNYEMAMDNRWVEYGKRKVTEKKCEIGLHIHAWNSPPFYKLEKNFSGHPYISEYPEHIVLEKITKLAKLLREKFECDITSARSGRWATNEDYFRALSTNDIKVDCSVTPELNLSGIQGYSKNMGNDYTRVLYKPYMIYEDIMEVPMSTKKVRWPAEGSLKHRIKSLIIGDQMWLRPHKGSRNYLKVLTDSLVKENGYLEFMIHSSELMPKGSPYFRSEEQIKQLYELLRWYFEYIASMGYNGVGLSDFARENKEK